MQRDIRTQSYRGHRSHKKRLTGQRKFLFRLALAMGMPVRTLEKQMGSDELTEWQAFYQLEPWGDIRADFRAGIIASVLANSHRGSHAPPFSPQDFMPFVEKPPVDIASNIRRFKAMFGHKVKT